MGNSAELIVSTALKPLVPNATGTPSRCAPDIGGPGVTKPYITYQAAGGQSTQPLKGDSGIRNTRMQINVWAESRTAATALMASVEAELANDTIKAIPIGRPVSVYEEDTKLYGSILDFSIWWNP